ncbi:MAG TPA: SDR family oxidoreductase [Gemmatirosa sp.]|nr:SDR family oxidoreductase [Gemmatirosa sp.]
MSPESTTDGSTLDAAAGAAPRPTAARAIVPPEGALRPADEHLDPRQDRRRAPRGRLAGKIALVTGAAGNIGQVICRRYLREGATVVMLGRDPAKLSAARETLRAETRAAASRIASWALDAADPGQVRAAVEQIVARFGRIDILVNNAGSAGPKRPIAELPFTRDELPGADGQREQETVVDAARNLLGLPWNLVRAVAPHLRPGASIVNVSTIFSRTHYFGRAAYVVPKAALNALSRVVATELGPRGIRVNTVLPGPIESERIRTVFGAMDRLRAAEPGATAREYLDLMALHPATGGEEPAPRFPTPDDVANTIVFLGSDESAGMSGHNFEVTHGMAVRQESRSTWVSRPELRTVDGTGTRVLVAAGDQVADALAVSRLLAQLGAEVVLGLGTEEGVRAAAEALGAELPDRRIRPALFDRTRPESMRAVLASPEPAGDATPGDEPARPMPLHGAVIFPAYGAWRFRGPFSAATDADVANFLEAEIGGALSVARELTRHWARATVADGPPHVVFLSNGSDHAENRYGSVLSAAMEELVRVWRDESAVVLGAGGRAVAEWANQVVRWTNEEAEEVPFAAGQAARLLFTRRRIRQVNLYLPVSIPEATGSSRASFGWMEHLMGLHTGKVALITGGSAGIGGQVGRLLAIAGARVVLCARRAAELDAMRASIVREVSDIGYWEAEERVHVVADVDVADEASLRRAVDETLARYGRVDYLVNNAGVAGAEEMVADMSLDAWRYTLDANLVSNFSLIEKLVPIMKRQGSGYILNVSSYFGGEKFVAVPYPNRSDYAVSKAGQRALTENLARFCGPEIQINAIAPGPVDGDRLRGVGGKPGLFERRGKLILENRRLNAVWEALVECLRLGAPLAALLARLGENSVPALRDASAPEPLRELAERIARASASCADDASCGTTLMTPAIARKLVGRLTQRGALLDDAQLAFHAAGDWLAALPRASDPFFPREDIQREAAKVRDGVLGVLHLKRMPSEFDVALATVYYMADRAVSGETFQPSGGLQQERSITERELFGRAKPERVVKLHGRTVWLVGEHLHAHLAVAARRFLTECHAGCVALVTRTAEAADAVRRQLSDLPDAERVRTFVVGEALEAGLDRALAEAGAPACVVSTPFAPLPSSIFDEPRLDTVAFRALVEDNLTHHFRVARRVVLMDDVRLVLVSPDVPVHPTPAEFALANFVKTTLHAFTATLGVESERLVHQVPVNQVNLTRRVRSEEPRDPAEFAEELDRFAHAVVLAGAPLPDADTSRYRSRIYRGLAITV